MNFGHQRDALTGRLWVTDERGRIAEYGIGYLWHSCELWTCREYATEVVPADDGGEDILLCPRHYAEHMAEHGKEAA
ncbi:MAG TPA: hypothetical protein VEA41_09175 [Salinarimonas sp.]|nr:hypothetical protein [Salinarimonas sp.]